MFRKLESHEVLEIISLLSFVASVGTQSGLVFVGACVLTASYNICKLLSAQAQG